MATFRLIEQHGVLYFPKGDMSDDNLPSLLIRMYPAGDCDTCPWPIAHRTDEAELKQRLLIALYDERETNPFFPSDAVIELPDGQVFDFQGAYHGIS